MFAAQEALNLGLWRIAGVSTGGSPELVLPCHAIVASVPLTATIRAPEAAPTPLPATRASPPDIRRRDRLGGLLHEYELAA